MKFMKNTRFEESASGINPEYSEIHVLMQDVMDFESGYNEIASKNKENQKKIEMKKQEQGKNMRLKCMDKLPLRYVRMFCEL